MFQFVDDFDKRDNHAPTGEISLMDEFIRTGSVETALTLIGCSCVACRGNSMNHSPQETHASSYMVEHAYRLVIRVVGSIGSGVINPPVRIPSIIHVRKGLPRSVVWGHDVGDSVVMEPVNSSKMEELRSVPTVMQDLLSRSHQVSPQKRAPMSTTFSSRTSSDCSLARFFTLNQFKSILSDNRKHAKSVWEHVSHITLCPWVDDSDDWVTTVIRYDSTLPQPTDTPDVGKCRGICEAIKLLLEQTANLKVISGRFTFYRRPSDDASLPWWLGDVSELMVVTVPATQSQIQ